MNIKADMFLSGHSQKKFPDFLTERMDHFFNERWGKLWGGKHLLRGEIPAADAIQMISNDYLSLASHRDVIEAQVTCLRTGPESVMMSGSLMRGDTPQRRFEKRMAEYVGYEAGILCQSGYAANVGLIQSISETGMPVYMDMNAHASLWEGVRSGGASVRPFRHNDLQHLQRQMERYGPGLLCVDSVYSTTGSLCHLPEVVALAEHHDCMVLVDESHSLGTHGPSGAGLVRELGLLHRVHFVTASLAKAFCGRAGLILCPRQFSEYFWMTSLPAIFSSCLLPAEIAGLDTTLDIIMRDEWRRELLHTNADYLRDGLSALGYNVTASDSQIISLEAGAEDATLLLRESLERQGVFGSVFCAPATAKGRSMVRFSVNAGLTRAQLDHVLRVCDVVREEVGMAQWPSTQRLARDVTKRELSMA
ncbi:quorum-sensing autoinducer CAI-1 synthase [Alcanivorax sp. JB21]|uniref:alpha-hydroxyketone-type quorum-sensing autoinducer synthase n=1 Tax=Alcanivorax limicola TaxID=2874102 RepID=UPI001CC0C778|nr:alpha-hydroxyketone-type quorum-sensing autoinducer synthase [Alcanivorax limicola]MBZ2190168.1 quorum-sensing autoinducer CAI-1 synthase [Alcanivorax limicola]